MDIEIVSGLRGAKRTKWIEFLSRAGLEADEGVQRTILPGTGGDEFFTVPYQNGALHTFVCFQSGAA